MNFRSHTSLRPCAGLVLTLAMVLGGCTASPMSRIDAGRAQYESWPLDVQEAVLSGQAKPGMTPEQVEMALGKPSEVVNRSSDEVWVYKKSGGISNALGNTGLSVGTAIGPVAVGTGSTRRRPSNADEIEVVFHNGVVSRADTP
jgi:hypothetical protein